jgi:hypothetical protein
MTKPLEHVLAAVRAAMREQGRSLSGAQGHGLTLGVETAVTAFAAGTDLAPTLALFAELGRTEYREGHRVDALRSILTIGAQTYWAALVGDPGPVPPAELYVVAARLFGYVDALAGAAAEGYLDEQRDAAHDWAQARRRLITLLVQPDPPTEAALRPAAEAARWPLPARLSAWLRAQGQVVPAARALHTHPQTIRYRMRRLRELFGTRLDDPDERLALQLALHSARFDDAGTL